MKTKLTPEDSQYLIALGVPKEKASKFGFIDNGKIVDGIELPPVIVPVFTLTDLLEILPKEIETYKICPFRMESWFVEGTPVWDIQYVGAAESFIQNKELIDALYELACWYYGEFLKRQRNGKVGI